MTPRAEAELALLREVFPGLEVAGSAPWVRVPGLRVPSNRGWNREVTDVAIMVPPHPGTPPYGIYVPVGLRVHGALPGSYTEPAPQQPPFPGPWGIFSWSPEGAWVPTADVRAGPNLVNLVRSLGDRLREGA